MVPESGYASLPGKQTSFDIRVYEADKVLSAGVGVRDYTSLDNHPELIVLQGRYNKKTAEVHLDQFHEQQLKAA